MGRLVELVGGASLFSACSLLLLHGFENVVVSAAADLLLRDGSEGRTPAIGVLHFDCGDRGADLGSHIADHSLIILEVSAVEGFELWQPNFDCGSELLVSLIC